MISYLVSGASAALVRISPSIYKFQYKSPELNYYLDLYWNLYMEGEIRTSAADAPDTR